MTNDINIQKALLELVSTTGEQPLSIRPLAASGSSRKYYRITTKEHSLIGAFNATKEENRAFFYLASYFQEQGLSVPKIFIVNEQENCYLMEDLGDSTLMDYIVADGGEMSASLVMLLQRTMEELIKFQCSGHKGLDYGMTYPTPSFDKKSILDDLLYFKYYFLKLHPKIEFNEVRLSDDFETLAEYIIQAPNDFFMYRDFQSRNIMVHDNKLYFIDFQGGRRGPLQYDVVSFLYQVKAQFSEQLRQELLQHYHNMLLKVKPDAAKVFYDYLPAFVILRLMQVLGAYGYRGLIQHKVHFLESLPRAIREFKHHFQNASLPLRLPELTHIVGQLPSLYDDYPINNSSCNNRLTVSINSFSYRKGYPNDVSGNGGGFVFDCRPLPNPGRMEEYKQLTGRDKAVADYLKQQPEVLQYLEHCRALLSPCVDNYIQRQFTHLMISFGCTGGQHRSVFFAQSIFEWFKNQYPMLHIELYHREQNIRESHEG